MGARGRGISTRQDSCRTRCVGMSLDPDEQPEARSDKGDSGVEVRGRRFAPRDEVTPRGRSRRGMWGHSAVMCGVLC